MPPQALSANPESSLLMWLVASAVALLAVQVFLGWLRQAQRAAGWRRRALLLLLAAAVLGTGLNATVVLALAGEATDFPMGYQTTSVLLLGLGAVAGSAVAALPMLRSHRWWMLGASGVMLACLAAALQAGWLIAAGFRPGLVWQPQFIGAAVIVMILACGGGLWIGLGNSRDRPRRLLWRLGASALIGLGVVAGQELLTAGAGLPAQVGSVYQNEVPSSVLGLLCGVLLPLVLGAMALDQAIRHNQRALDGALSHAAGGTRTDPVGAPPGQRRRRRRHRIRGL